MADIYMLPGGAVPAAPASKLAAECDALVALGINPVTLVMYARALKFPAVITAAFPAMPFSTLDDLMSGHAVLILDHQQEWQILRLDPT